MFPISNELRQRVEAIRLLVLDVDGVLTDGSIVYTNTMGESKTFHVRDGLGLQLWQHADRSTAIITGRNSSIVTRRAEELGIVAVRQGSGDKSISLDKVRVELGFSNEQICVMGDDLPDLPMMAQAAVTICPSDAADEVRSICDWTTTLPGGRGAVREAIEWLLKIQGLWAGLIRPYQQ